MICTIHLYNYTISAVSNEIEIISSSTVNMKILFICIGNTCRSPMAEAIMQNMISQHKLDWIVDSAGLRSWNVGVKPEPRCIKVLFEHGISTQHLGRLITADDFQQFDHILAMDRMNLKELQDLGDKYKTKPNCNIALLGSYIGRKEDEIIGDPYFSEGTGAFRTVYMQIHESCANFIRHYAK